MTRLLRTFYLLLPIENKTRRVIDLHVRKLFKNKRFRLVTLLGEATPHNLEASCKLLASLYHRRVVMSEIQNLNCSPVLVVADSPCHHTNQAVESGKSVS